MNNENIKKLPDNGDTEYELVISSQQMEFPVPGISYL